MHYNAAADHSFLSSKCSLTHGIKKEYIAGNEHPTVKTPLLLSFSLQSAALQCFPAHAQTDWESATATLSTLEILTACITDTFV